MFLSYNKGHAMNRGGDNRFKFPRIKLTSGIIYMRCFINHSSKRKKEKRDAL